MYEVQSLFGMLRGSDHGKFEVGSDSPEQGRRVTSLAGLPVRKGDVETTSTRHRCRLFVVLDVAFDLKEGPKIAMQAALDIESTSFRRRSILESH